MEMTVCDRSRVVAQFRIPFPKPCFRHTPESISSCSVQIYNPKPNALKIPMFACSLSVTRWTTTKFFFGAKTSKIFDPIFQAISVSRCNKIALTLRDEVLGNLVSLNSDTFGTTNDVKVQYSWPKGVSGEVFNIILKNTSFIFEQTNRRMFSPLSEMKHCEISACFCKDQKFVFIWQFDANFLCPVLTEGKNGSDAFLTNLHYLQNGNLSFIEIPQMALSFHSEVACSTYVKSCFAGRLVVCLPNGYILDLKTCNDSNNFDFFKLKMMSSAPLFGVRPESATLNFISDVSATFLSELTHSVNFVDCKIEHSMSIMLRLLSKTYPSEILSLLLNRTVGALSIGDTLGLLHCENKTVTVKPFLKVGHLFSTRPLVDVFVNNISVTYQVYPDGIAYKELTFLEAYKPFQDAIFLMNDKLFHYKNYTLEISNSKVVIPIFPRIDAVSLHFPILDYELLLQNRPSYSTESVSYYSALSLLQSNVRSLDIIKSMYNDFLNFDPVVKVEDVLRGSLSTSFSHIRSPFLIVLFYIFHLLSNFWVFVATLIFIRFLWLRYKNKRVRNTDNAETTT